MPEFGLNSPLPHGTRPRYWPVCTGCEVALVFNTPNGPRHESFESHEPLGGGRSPCGNRGCWWCGCTHGHRLVLAADDHGLHTSRQERGCVHRKPTRAVSERRGAAVLERDWPAWPEGSTRTDRPNRRHRCYLPQGCTGCDRRDRCHRRNWTKRGVEFHDRRDSWRCRHWHGHGTLPCRSGCNRWRR